MQTTVDVYNAFFEATLSLPSRIITTCFSLSIVFFLFLPASCILICARRSTSAMYKAVELEVISIIGFTSILLTQLIYTWTLTVTNTFALYAIHLVTQITFYVTGYTLSLVPIIVRMWRIVSLYRRTVDWRFKKSVIPIRCRIISPLKRKRRATRWMFTRVAIGTVPAVSIVSIAIFPFGITDTVADLLWTVNDLAILILLMGMFVTVLITSPRINLHDLVESRSLLLLSAICVVYNAADNIMWWGVLRYRPETLMVHVWIATVCNTIIFICLVTPTLISIAMRRHRRRTLRPKEPMERMDDYPTMETAA